METSGYILGRHLLQESLSDYTVKFSLFSLRAVLTNYLTMRCIIYHHSAIHQVVYYILLSTCYNKSVLSNLQNLWLESSISILKCPVRTLTSFPQEPTLGHHWNTWLGPSHSWYNTRGDKRLWNGGGGRDRFCDETFHIFKYDFTRRLGAIITLQWKQIWHPANRRCDGYGGYCA